MKYEKIRRNDNCEDVDAGRGFVAMWQVRRKRVD